VASDRFSVPISSVQSVGGSKHVEGIVEGAGIGLLSGALLGAIMLGVSYPEDGTYAAGVGFILGAAAGLIGGMVYGGIKGHTYTYEFTSE
jgi:hypothetical protein